MSTVEKGDAVAIVPTDSLPIAMRAYVERLQPPATVKRSARREAGPSRFVLVFDTETTINAAQTLRIGAYQVRENGVLINSGIFFEPEMLTTDEQIILRKYAEDSNLNVLTREGFVENIFYKYGYYFRGTIVGFNLPFDLSRLAIRHSAARKSLRGGFSFELSANTRRPRIRIRHLSGRASLIEFAATARQRDSRSVRKRKTWGTPPRKGYFVDAGTLGAALTSQSFSLKRLADHLGTEHRKLEAKEHGTALTEAYIDYAVQDVQVTWECFAGLCAQYASHNLSRTHRHRILSEASLGKAYLKEMKIRPWREVQPDFPASVIGSIMSAYYGGRSEVRIRRAITQVVYCDFLSMYPTVCTLMGLWRFVIATGLNHQDATEEARNLIEALTIGDLQKPEFWPLLTMIVQVIPSDDILPVRAKYDDQQLTIGLNRLTGCRPVWYTLADVIASKLLTGRVPRITRAIKFSPAKPQAGLEPIDILGQSDYRVDAYKDDFFRKAIDLRTSVKRMRDAACGDDRSKLDTEQQALKILANSTSYGIFVEFNVEDHGKSELANCFGHSDEGFPITAAKTENPGTFFHPLLATLITGAARLLLVISESLISHRGLGWALCDTDSMAIAKPDGMSDKQFYGEVQSIVGWFTPLNPYQAKQPLLKIEDINFGVGAKGGDLCPLYCLAISAKRYALFNLDAAGMPVLRKASAHGLGHLVAPYNEDSAPSFIPAPLAKLSEIGVKRWQHDLWHMIIVAMREGHPDQVRLDNLPGFNRPAASRYHATTPDILKWFDVFNRGKGQLARVKPFNFLLSFSQSRQAAFDGNGEVVFGAKARPKKARGRLQPIAPFDTDIEQAARMARDRDTDVVVPYSDLQTYREALAQYHLHPEAKFLNGEFLRRGETLRRHIVVTGINHIGKEANRWEEQHYLGADPEAQIEYGVDPAGAESALHAIRSSRISQRRLAAESGISLRQISAILTAKAVPRASTLARLLAAANALRRSEGDTAVT